MGVKVAIAGVTGAVGQEFLRILEQRNFPADSLKCLASERSVGKKTTFKGNEYPVELLTENSFKGIDIALFSAGGQRSRDFAPAAAKAGAVVVDNSSAFRMDPDVPLVVPEINPEMIKKHKGIIANPNCSTIIAIVPVWPLHKANPVKRMIVSTYQAASGAGQSAMLELIEQAKEVLAGRPVTCKALKYQLAFNLYCHDSKIGPNGYNEEEIKMAKDFQLPEYRDYRDLRACAGAADALREHQSRIRRPDYPRTGQRPAGYRAGREHYRRPGKEPLPDADRRHG